MPGTPLRRQPRQHVWRPKYARHIWTWEGQAMDRLLAYIQTAIGRIAPTLIFVPPFTDFSNELVIAW